MTVNQISYQNLQEKMRNDRAIEAETYRHNKAVEDYNAGVLSNAQFQNVEIQRHNQAVEELQARANAIEAYRAQLQSILNSANIRIAETRAAEEHRSNVQNELLTAQRNANEYNLRMQEITTNRYLTENAQGIQRQSLAETNRHNLTTESISQQNTNIQGLNSFVGMAGTMGTLSNALVKLLV